MARAGTPAAAKLLALLARQPAQRRFHDHPDSARLVTTDGNPPGERPADLGYFMGYRIAQAYYEKASDKRAALRDIIRGVDVERIVAQSGYDPQ